MDRISRYYFAAALGLILARAVAAGWTGASWGFNHLHYLSLTAVIFWTAGGAVLLFPPFFQRVVAAKWNDPGRPWPIWLIGALVFLVLSFSPMVGASLLGDGLDRLEATLAGTKSLRGQPAPLDILIHILIYRLGAYAQHDPLTRAWRIWIVTSHLAGGAAVAAVCWLSRLRGENRGERAFLLVAILAAGTWLFFLGYVEDYVLLAAALYFYLVLLEMVSQKRAPVWSLFLAQFVLVSLHYFMALLCPVTVYVLYRHAIFRPRPIFLAVAAVLLAGFGAFALVMVRAHYGGLAAIFVKPHDLFSFYHLAGFFNQQILAGPAGPLLLLLALAGKKPKEPDPLLSFTGLSSAVLMIFFFFLRPVLGPALDWDLFALPSLLFTPWLALRALRGLHQRAGGPGPAWAIMVLTLVSTGPWLQVNTNEAVSRQRYKDLVEWEARSNSWAASYGYLRFGKYLSRHPFERRNPEVLEAFQRALEINPDSATLRLQVARAYENMGREDLARPQMAEHFRLKGQDEVRKMRFEEAAQSFESALEFAPGSSAALSALVNLYEGPLANPEKAAYYRKRLEEAGRKVDSR